MCKVAGVELSSSRRRALAAVMLSLLSLTWSVRPTLAGFQPQETFGTGSRPLSVAAADLNGDGKLDLAVANFDSNTVSVLLNTAPAGAATPTFAAQVPFTVGPVPYSVAAADLNGDGKTDLATNTRDSNSVSVLLANPSGSLQVASSGATVAEGGGTTTVKLSRTGSTDGQVSAILSATGGTATQRADFTLAGPQTVTWADGDGTDKTVTIPIIQDQVDEGDETIQLTLSLPTNPFGATLGTRTTSILTIADDDPLVLNIANVSVAEGNDGIRNATFTATRIGNTARTVTVQYATADGSAQAGSDYTATSGALTFGTGEASKTITVPILGDTRPEPDETFTVTLSHPTNAMLGVGQAIGVIKNDDVTVSAACTPRPRVTQTVAASGGALNVHVESTPLTGQANNPLHQITFGTLQNATVTLNGQAVSSGQAVSLPPNSVGTELVVQRPTAGQPTMVPFTVVDGCGEWQTFVGGGASAGF
jgi:uncharacterized protein YggU (UPF0235/DUF167 family)